MWYHASQSLKGKTKQVRECNVGDNTKSKLTVFLFSDVSLTFLCQDGTKDNDHVFQAAAPGFRNSTEKLWRSNGQNHHSQHITYREKVLIVPNIRKIL